MLYTAEVCFAHLQLRHFCVFSAMCGEDGRWTIIANQQNSGLGCASVSCGELPSLENGVTVVETGHNYLVR